MGRHAFALLVLLACWSPMAGSAETSRPAGVDLSVVADGPAQLRCRVTWFADAPLGRVEVHGPPGIRAASSSTVLLDQLRADGDRVRLTGALGDIRAGDSLEVLVDLAAISAPSTVVVVAERVAGPVTDQIAVAIEVTPTEVRVGPPSASRLTLVADGPAADDGVAAPGTGYVLIEPLDGSIKLTADVFVEDHANVAIPDGPAECGGSSTDWAVQRVVSITTAPPAAVITGITVHVTVTHPDMSDVEILFLHDFGSGSFLWNNGDGVNLDRDYSRDLYNQPLDGMGLAVNATYMLGARDCVATDTGTLDYWSLRVTYDAPATVDLVATSIAGSPTQVAPGGSVAATWSGQVTGSGTVGSPFTVGFYLSPDATVTTADVLLGQTTVSGVSPGDTFGEAAPGRALTIPAGTAPGSYVLGLLVDSGNAIDETNEANNSRSSPLTVSDMPPGVTRWLVPAAASTPGVGTSDWRSEVAIVNRTAGARSASLYFVARGAPWPGTLISGPTPLAPNQSLFLEDPLLAQNPTSGLLHVVLDAPGPVVTSRTYNLGPGGATYGQGIPAQPLDGATAPTELVLPLVHSVPGRFRTNLGLIQTSSGPFQVEVTAYSPGGTVLAVKSYTRSSGYDQINDLFADLGLASLSVEGAWLRVRLVSGSPQTWTCYASVVDALTGDPTFVAPVDGS